MAEIKKVWMVRNPQDPDMAADPVFRKKDGTLDMENILAQFFDPEGMSVDTMVSIIIGGSFRGGDAWRKEKTKIYDDEASARRDAEARMKRYMMRYKKKSYTYSR